MSIIIQVGYAVDYAHPNGTGQYTKSSLPDLMMWDVFPMSMPITSGQYWNGVYGREKGETAADAG